MRASSRQLAILSLLALTADVGARGGEFDPALGAPFEQRDRPALGPADAPVTVIEVRSFRCGHCRTFHQTVFPALRRDYVDTRRVRWVMLDADDSDPRNTIFEVARAAQAAGAYWKLNGFFFSQARRSSSVIRSAIEREELPARRVLLEALRDGSARIAADADLAEARKLNLDSLPAFLLRRALPDGSFTETRLQGEVRESDLRAALDTMVAAATNSLP